MCGIAGIFQFKTGNPVQESLLLNMRDTMVHRGPDDGGIYLDQELGLAHRRLSILDLSARGHQPMTSRDGRHVVCFNGEIYNFLELKNQHFSGDTDFVSHSDTEVLLAMYGKFGPACVEHFNGMFAFAIWDRQEKSLFLARDRLGKKPLYYAWTAEGLAFASEMKALMRVPGIDKSIVERLLPIYMTYGYVAGEHTLLQGVHKLAAGHRMLIKNRKVETSRYWSPTFAPESDRGEKVYVEEFSKLLEDATQLRLRSDVPLGIFLSGGLDSSAVVAILSGNRTQKLKTFSVAFDFGKDYDETPHARKVAAHFGTEHHDFFLTPKEFQDSIPTYIWHMDEPVCQASAIPLYHIAKKAKEYVTVVLSGEGADELLGGYDIYNYMRVLQKYRHIPAAVRKMLSACLFQPLGLRKILKYDALAKLPLEKTYYGVDLYSRNGIDAPFTKAFRSRMDESYLDTFSAQFQDPGIAAPLNKMLSFDTRTWLVDNLLMKADKMSMAPSLELRCPFLDYRLVEFCARLPLKYKIHGFEKKYLLKQAMKEKLPASILERKKVGFPTPLNHMFRSGLAEYAGDVLRSSAFLNRGYFEGSAVSTLLDDHHAGKGEHHRELWQLLVLEQWFRTFVDA